MKAKQWLFWSIHLSSKIHSIVMMKASRKMENVLYNFFSVTSNRSFLLNFSTFRLNTQSVLTWKLKHPIHILMQLKGNIMQLLKGSTAKKWLQLSLLSTTTKSAINYRLLMTTTNAYLWHCVFPWAILWCGKHSLVHTWTAQRTHSSTLHSS